MQNFEEYLDKILGGEFSALNQFSNLGIKNLSAVQAKKLLAKCDEVISENSNAMMLKGYFLMCRGKESDCMVATSLYEKAIKLGNPSAMFCRAIMYQYGVGGVLNIPLAITLYEDAIKQGHSGAMNTRAALYEKGIGSEINYPAAIKLLEDAIQLNDFRAMYNRARMHAKGRGGQVDDAAAINLYEAAIKFGHIESMYNRAVMHEKGIGGPVNHSAAISLYEEAIRLGCTMAMHNRAMMHLQGIGGPLDNFSAAKLLRQINIYHREEDALDYSENATVLVDLCDTEHLETYYQAAMALVIIDKMDITLVIQFLGLSFLRYLAKDNLCSIDTKMMYVEEFLNIRPLIMVEDDVDTINLLGRYYLQKGRAVTLHKDFVRAIEYFQQVPVESDSRSEACFALGHFIYQNALKNGCTSEAAFDFARAYLLEGTKLGDEGCKDLLKAIIESIVGPDEKTDLNDNVDIDVDELLRKYAVWQGEKDTNKTLSAHNCYRFFGDNEISNASEQAIVEKRDDQFIFWKLSRES